MQRDDRCDAASTVPLQERYDPLGRQSWLSLGGSRSLPSPNPTIEAKRNRLSAETIFKTLTALFGLIAAVLGIFVTQQTNQKEKAKDQSLQLQQQIDSLNGQVAALEQQLKAQPTTTGSDGPSRTGSTGTFRPASGPGTINYEFTLPHQKGIDLDNK
jgi:hypothetical protein